MKNSLEFDAFKFDNQKLIFHHLFNFFRPIYPELEILSVQKPPIIKNWKETNEID